MRSKLPRGQYDLIVVGSGAGGLSAAVTAAHAGLSVAVFEKADVLGGTSAWSGGWLWIPGNHLAEQAGIKEDPAATRTYIKNRIGRPELDARIERFLETGPEMVRFFERETAVEWMDGNVVPDFVDVEGSLGGGRSVTAANYDIRELGPWADVLRPPIEATTVFGLGLTASEIARYFFNWRHSLQAALYVIRRLTPHFWHLLRYRRAVQVCAGNALVARLIRSAVDFGVELFPGRPATRLLRDGDRVVGARIEGAGPVYADKGVVLACGGFPHDHELLRRLGGCRDGGEHHSAAPRTNTGDGLRLGEEVGAKVRDDLPHACAWAPVSLLPDKRGGVVHFPHLLERAKPGIIAVTGKGVRFCNEAENYHHFMSRLFEVTPPGQRAEAWLIADHKAQRRWGLGASRPFPFRNRPYLESGYLKKADTLAELARVCGLDPDTLERTVAEFNRHAELGKDPEFHRGESRYNRFMSGRTPLPNPSLAPLAKPPFYAVRIVPGSLGTFAGLATDELARVLDRNDRPIAGLFAVGNDASSIFEGFYPSGGITLGPAMTFGYIAARVAAGLIGTETSPQMERRANA